MAVWIANRQRINRTLLHFHVHGECHGTFRGHGRRTSALRAACCELASRGGDIEERQGSHLVAIGRLTWKQGPERNMGEGEKAS